jgi:hypothetical protein
MWKRRRIIKHQHPLIQANPTEILMQSLKEATNKPDYKTIAKACRMKEMMILLAMKLQRQQEVWKMILSGSQEWGH